MERPFAGSLDLEDFAEPVGFHVCQELVERDHALRLLAGAKRLGDARTHRLGALELLRRRARVAGAAAHEPEQILPPEVMTREVTSAGGLVLSVSLDIGRMTMR